MCVYVCQCEWRKGGKGSVYCVQRMGEEVCVLSPEDIPVFLSVCSSCHTGKRAAIRKEYYRMAG